MIPLRWHSASAITSAALISAFALSACAPDDVDDDDEGAQPTATVTETVEAEPADELSDETTDSPDEDTDPTDATGSPGADGGGEMYQAVDAVMAEYPEAVVLELERESSYYEFTIFEGGSEWEIDVDRDSYEISNARESSIDSDDQRKAEAVEIELVDALRIASEAGDGAPEQVELDDDNGTVVWEIDLDNGREIYVDVATGDVVSGGDD